MSIIRKGDIVSVRAKVVAGAEIAGTGSIYVDLGYHYSGTAVELDRVALVEPHFEVGETVSIVDGRVTGTVRGTAPGHVWVEHENGTFATYLAHDLRRVATAPTLTTPDLMEGPPSAPEILASQTQGAGDDSPEF